MDETTRLRMRRKLAGVEGFAAEMREKGIHVGMGESGQCVTCGEPWPCEGGRG
jgi:hypothetical protein